MQTNTAITLTGNGREQPVASSRGPNSRDARTMIQSATEFVRLRSSQDPAEYARAAKESAPLDVWREVIEEFPEFRRWVAYNKTVPLDILLVLADDADPSVRWQVAAKNKLSPELLERLANDEDESVRQRVVRHKRLLNELLE